MDKFCKDCRYFKYNQSRSDSCTNPASTTVNLVDGSHRYESCHAMRARNLDGCGTSGKLFELKPAEKSTWQHLKELFFYKGD